MVRENQVILPRAFMVIWAMDEQDTICAVSTPVGSGGIGIIRISGSRSVAISGAIFRARSGAALASAATHTIQYGHVVEPATGKVVDEVLVNVMHAPRTYTREDVVEINCHGGAAPLLKTMKLLIQAGARQAEPGEFTKRAFMNGRIDLAQAEAVMDIIRSRTERALEAAHEQLQGGLSREVRTLRDRLVRVVAGVEASVDFPEEDIETASGLEIEEELRDIAELVQQMLDGAAYGRILREGLATAIAGRPNVGKSSLLNALLKQDRAIVTEVPGTTRDVLEEYLNVEGMPLRIVDTAGIRQTDDIVEQEGVRRSRAAIASADIVLVVLDGSETLTNGDREVLEAAKSTTAIAVINKSDRKRKLEKLDWPEKQVEVSCRNGEGFERLHRELLALMEEGAVRPGEHAWAVNQRQKTALERTKNSLEKALASVLSSLSPEFIALDLRDGLDHLGMIIGATHREDILERIFRDFCIGK